MNTHFHIIRLRSRIRKVYLFLIRGVSSVRPTGAWRRFDTQATELLAGNKNETYTLEPIFAVYRRFFGAAQSAYPTYACVWQRAKSDAHGARLMQPIKHPLNVWLRQSSAQRLQSSHPPLYRQ